MNVQIRISLYKFLWEIELIEQTKTCDIYQFGNYHHGPDLPIYRHNLGNHRVLRKS